MSDAVIMNRLQKQVLEYLARKSSQKVSSTDILDDLETEDSRTELNEVLEGLEAVGLIKLREWNRSITGSNYDRIAILNAGKRLVSSC